MRAWTAAIAIGLGLASCSEERASVPTRECGLTVWHKPRSSGAAVFVLGSWDGFSRPGTRMPETGRADGYRSVQLSLPVGTYRYFLVEDGERLLDVHVPTTTYEPEATAGFSLQQYGGSSSAPPPARDEVNVVDVGACEVPQLVIDEASALGEGTVRVRARFLSAGSAPSPLDVQGAALTDRLTGASAAPSFADSETGALEFLVNGVEQRKARFDLTARALDGTDAEPQPVSIWLEPEPLLPEDWLIYQVVIDRFRGDDGPPAQPEHAASRAGGTLRGVSAALRDGTFERLGVNALWLSPVYDNPEGLFAGEPGRSYSGYHGYWPIAAREVEPEIGTEADLEQLMSEAHQRGVRVLFDLVPNHVHEQHPVFRQRSSDALFNGTDGSCTCGSEACPWNTSIQICWFAPYLPDHNGRLDAVAKRETDDARFWLERYGADGLRIDAVPMMTRALTRRIVWGARDRLEHPGYSLFFVGETFTGQGGFGDLKYHLGPQGLSSQFHFPLMWALRGAINREHQPMSAVADILAESAQAFEGSGAVMATMIGNHDVTRFASESDGSAGGDGWTPAPAPSSAEVYEKQRFGLGLVMTLPGAPVIYYGDEIALPGARDPDSRRVFPAELSGPQLELRASIERLGQLRRCSRALRRGRLQVLERGQDRLVFERALEDERVIVVAERHPGGPVTLPSGEWVLVSSGEPVSGAVLPAASADWSLRILRSAGAEPCGG